MVKSKDETILDRFKAMKPEKGKFLRVVLRDGAEFVIRRGMKGYEWSIACEKESGGHLPGDEFIGHYAGFVDSESKYFALSMGQSSVKTLSVDRFLLSGHGKVIKDNPIYYFHNDALFSMTLFSGRGGKSLYLPEVKT